MKMPRLFLTLLLMFPLAVSAELKISEGWIKHLPPPVPVRAGYLTLKNYGSNPISIKSVRSDSFAQIEIHRSTEVDGMMSMEPVPQLTIEAGSSVQLVPGGLHLMMLQPTEPGKPGDIIRITVVLDNGSEKILDMVIKK